MTGQPIILGTAGHIDHGKTALVKALTGIDTDRLKEEQRRGITIELGFAHLMVEDTHFGVVDVPGHERFIKSMVAGAAGIDLVMLVVAADEGVMPQTREHLDICQLLGVHYGLVALTKADLVDAEWLQLVQEDLETQLAQTFLQGAPIMPCSAITGQGIEALKKVLHRLAQRVPTRDPHGLLRLPLDRVFTLKGFGTIVTGTLLSGTLVVGEEVCILPGAVQGKVRGLHVHGQPVEKAVAGQRTAVNLGGVDRHEVARGEVLAHPNRLAPSSMIDVQLQLLPNTRKPLPVRSKVIFHLGTRQQEATCVLLGTARPREGTPEDRLQIPERTRLTLEPGQSALAQLRFDRPVVALPQDRFILRGFHKQENYGTTIGGGLLLRVLSRKLRTKDAPLVASLTQILTAAPQERCALEVHDAGPPGLTRQQLQQRLPFVPEQLDRLVGGLLEQRRLIRFDKEHGSVTHTAHFDALLERLLAIVDRFHAEHPLEAGINREELRSRIGAGIDPRLYFALLQHLEKQGALVVERELCRRPSHTVQQAGQSIRPLAESLAEIYERAGLGPPWESDLAAMLKTDAQTIADAIKLLLDEARLTRVGTLYFDHAALQALHERLVAFIEREGQITAAQFKELVGQSRKYSIPLAEHFDAQKITLRVGDIRKLRR